MPDRKYEPRTAENVLRAELASITASIEFQDRRVTAAREQLTDARALRAAHTASRDHVLAAMVTLGIDTAGEPR